MTLIGSEQTTSSLVVLILFGAFSMIKPLVLPGVDKKALANNKAFKFLS